MNSIDEHAREIRANDGGKDSMQRQFLRRLAGATAGLLLTGTSLSAAELAPTPAPPPPPPPAFTWTGFELGAQVGGGVGRSTVNLPPFSDTYTGDPGVFGGLLIGYNYQFNGPLVVGLQAEYNFAGITGNASAPPLNFLETADREFGSVDGRLGLAFDRVLIYAIGGFAYGDIRNQILCGPMACNGFPLLTLGGGPITRDFAANRYGFDVGGGIEYNIWGNWTVRAEYRYYDWGTRGFIDAGFPTNPISIPNHTSRETLQTGRIGLSYRFAWPPAPVVAKY
jgi:outer membrane immunogenic protein